MAQQTGTPQGEMTFLQHLEALRWHLVKAAAAVFGLAILAFFNRKLLFDGILLAPKEDDFITFRVICNLGRTLGLGNDLCLGNFTIRLQNLDLSGQFTAHMMISFFAGLILAAPYVIYELWKFVKPALLEAERSYATGIVFATSLLFLTGIAFGYFVLTPFSINFLATYQVSESVENIISFDSYISMVTTMTLVSGLVFELPIAVYFLSKIGILTPVFMRTYRRQAVVIILILAAVITPTSDITTLVLTAFPLYLLYEASIFVSHRVTSKATATIP